MSRMSLPFTPITTADGIILFPCNHVSTPQMVRVAMHYPHHESLRGQVGKMVRICVDGTVMLRFYDGPHAGDRVCLSARYVELMS